MTESQDKDRDGRIIWDPKSIHPYKEINELGEYSDDNGLYESIMGSMSDFFDVKYF